MTSDQQRAMRRLHATAKPYGITHAMISEWADDVHGKGSTTEVDPADLDALSRQIDAEGDDYAALFLAKYAPRSITQFALLDVPEAEGDRWAS
jgi:hypothetical protein